MHHAINDLWKLPKKDLIDIILFLKQVIKKKNDKIARMSEIIEEMRDDIERGTKGI